VYNFFVRALCGRWTGPAKRTYSTEPAANEIEELAERLESQYDSCDTLDELKSWPSLGNGEVEKEVARNKLGKRLQKAYAALREAADVEELCPACADATLAEELVEQADALTPAVDLVRLQAIDRDLY